METVVFPAELEDGDASAAGVAMAGDGSPPDSDGPPPPPPPNSGDDNIDDDDLPTLLPTGDDDDDDIDDVDIPPPRVVRVSARGDRGVPATRYDEVFEVAADFMNPLAVITSMESGKEEEWTAAMDTELQSLWENQVFEKVDRHKIKEDHRYEVGAPGQK